jgi:5-methylcytosine-specific restriction endonuclease McrA
MWKTSHRGDGLPKDWNRRRSFVLRRDGFSCQIRLEGCLGAANEVDHIVRGDNHSPENLRAACKSCHGKKSSAEGHAVQARRRALRKRPPDRHPGSYTESNSPALTPLMNASH